MNQFGAAQAVAERPWAPHLRARCALRTFLRDPRVPNLRVLNGIPEPVHDMRTLLACLTLGAALLSMSEDVDAQATELDRSLEQLATDYTLLYTRETFAEWRGLFLPTFTSTSTTADGGTSVRSLEAFLGAQERGFQSARKMGERLERVRIDRRGRIAMIAADFEYWNDDTTRRGTLVLAAVHVREGWRFQSLVFSYPD